MDCLGSLGDLFLIVAKQSICCVPVSGKRSTCGPSDKYVSQSHSAVGARVSQGPLKLPVPGGWVKAMADQL